MTDKTGSLRIVSVAGNLWCMGSDARSVLRDGLALSEADRAEVAAELFASLQGPNGYSSDDATEWARSVEQRIERVASGETHVVDLAAARQRVDAALADG